MRHVRVHVFVCISDANLPIYPPIPTPTIITQQFFAREKARLLEEVDAKGSELSHALTTFQEAFDAERRERLEREGRILRQLGEHEQEVARRFEGERVCLCADRMGE